MHGIETIIALNARAQRKHDASQKLDAEIQRLHAANRVLERQLREANKLASDDFEAGK